MNIAMGAEINESISDEYDDQHDAEVELDEEVCVEDIIREAEIVGPRHIRSVNAQEIDEKTYVSKCCPFCRKNFDKIEHHILLSHMGLNILQYKCINCKLCGQEFETKEALVVHKALHLNKTDYLCQFSCGFSIGSKTLLKVHEKNDHSIDHIL